MNNRIFISYRRKGGDVTAKLISETLKNRGYETFYDYDGLKGGPFDQQIRNEILCCTDLVLILPKNALKRCKNKNDWVREEIRIALQHGKNIVPVMLDGFEFPETLPDDIDAVRRYNGVRFQMDYFEAVITKIIDKLSSSTHTAKPSKTTKAPVHSTADSTKRASSVPDAFKPRKSATKRAAAPTVNYESANDGRRTWQSGSDYTIPPLSLLNEIPPIPGISEADAEEIANRILGKLQSFGRSACFAGYSAGPTVTRFEFVPNEGVRINDILSLRDDIAMELGI